MTHTDEPHEGSGKAQETDSQAVPTQAIQEKSRKGPRLSRWFWGTIALLVVITLTLTLLAAWQAGRQTSKATSGGSDGDEVETNATVVEHLLDTAGMKAYEVKGQIGPLLDKAYAPVYAGIPAYMDFHYSLKGEYLELGSAALGDIGAGLDKYLFAGLEARLKNVATDLERDFDARYQGALEDAMAEVTDGAAPLASIVTKATDDAKSRMKMTARTVVGGALLKTLTKVFAKKLGTKLAAKVAAKTGTKWVAIGSGAGTGAGVCSWTGPGAVVCAVVGAGITWIGVDLAMVKLDEYVSRDDFERELRQLIDNHKEETRQALEKMLDGKKQAADSTRRAAVQKVALSELKDVDRLMACQKATDILGRYVSIQQDLQARSPANLEALQIALTNQAENHLLAPWVDEIEAAIADNDVRPWVYGEVTLTIDLPPGRQKDHAIRARLFLGQTSLDFDWTEGVSAGHYVLSTRPAENIYLEESQVLKLELVQKSGWLKFNRSFNGAVRFDPYKTLAEGSGLMPKAKVSLTIDSDKIAVPRPLAEVELPLAGVPMTKREMPEFCAK